MGEELTCEVIGGFLEACNDYDLDAIMGYFANDCVVSMPRGTPPRGDQYVGKDEVRASLAKRFEGIPNVHYGSDQRWVCGDDFGYPSGPRPKLRRGPREESAHSLGACARCKPSQQIVWRDVCDWADRRYRLGQEHSGETVGGARSCGH
ncbi:MULTISPECIES: nuclear transport factor 2 family protein [Cryobacterium]|uniref:Nuclear transport factor 2 family protein n=1 Tax=Cryobacterium levicorallinum TaxID=995038 RepID=A0A4R8VJA8_9MICO|nr:nuclear transport factor 2 family protein [Cryobacterium levicorallinum]